MGMPSAPFQRALVQQLTCTYQSMLFSLLSFILFCFWSNWNTWFWQIKLRSLEHCEKFWGSDIVLDDLPFSSPLKVITTTSSSNVQGSVIGEFHLTVRWFKLPLPLLTCPQCNLLETSLQPLVDPFSFHFHAHLAQNLQLLFGNHWIFGAGKKTMTARDVTGLPSLSAIFAAQHLCKCLQHLEVYPYQVAQTRFRQRDNPL